MLTTKSLSMRFLTVVGVVALTLFLNLFQSAPIVQARAGSSSTTIIGGGFVSNDKCDIPPTWMGEIRGKKRWVPTYFDKKGKPHAYCDRQTGIVIQRTPGTPGPIASPCDDGAECTWNYARIYCANLTVGDSGQKGWRLMYMPELAALVDTNSKSCTNNNLYLPDGHPFKDVQSGNYWSASSAADLPQGAWYVFFFNGLVGLGGKPDIGFHAWCGRGASAADAY